MNPMGGSELWVWPPPAEGETAPDSPPVPIGKVDSAEFHRLISEIPRIKIMKEDE